MQDSQVPLLFTSKGNIPLDSVVRKDGWDFSPTGIVYWDEYYLGEELVKRNVAVYQLPHGSTLSVSQGQLN